MGANLVYFSLLTFATLSSDELYMSRCLQLAKLGAGYVAPNPLVGAVLVHDGKIIGEGYHQQYGGPHAEVNCINSVAAENKQLISQSTIYVSLEPCAHFGKTPPCADLIIQHGIPKVVIGCLDKFAKVNGAGIQKLQNAGVEVVTGVLEKQAQELNKFFFCFHEKKRPYIILKWAQTADGFIAKDNYEAVKISNEYSNRWVHELRSSISAIMVGATTALHDNPSLTTRHWPGKNPVRIFIDKQLKVEATASLFNNEADTIVLNELKEEHKEHIHFARINKELALLPQLMELLFNKSINSLLVEGGSKLLQSFIDADLWDEAFVINNESLHLHSGIAAVKMPSQKQTANFTISTDRIDHFIND